MVKINFKYKNCVSLCCCLLVLWQAEVCLAGTWALKTKSADDFSQGLQALVESSEQLEIKNNDLMAIDKELKLRIDAFNSDLIKINLNNSELQKKLTAYNDTNKDKESKYKELNNEQDKKKSQLDGLDKEIAINKIHLSERKKQQEYLLELIGMVQKNGRVDLDHSVIMENQQKLKQILIGSIDRNSNLEKEWKRLSFWYGDTKFSIAELSGIRERLKNQIGELKKENITENWAKNHYQVQKLDMEIKSLIQQRNSLIGALELIENKYVGGERKSQTLEEEDKLQKNLVKLKRENKGIQRKVNELRLKMIELDKKKSYLEKMIGDK
jgi:chromosome segregation ATPase